MKRRNKTALRQTMIRSNMSWQWRPYGKHSLRNQMIKVISSPSMLISNFISRFNCVAIIFPIFSFYTFSQFYIWPLFTTNFKLFNCVVIIFSIFSFNTLFTDFTWQNCCSPPISNYLIVLLFLFSYSIVFSEIYSWQLFIVHHKFQIIFVLLLFFLFSYSILFSQNFSDLKLTIKLCIVHHKFQII